MTFSDQNLGKIDTCELCGCLINNQEVDYVNRVLKSGVDVTVRVHKICKKRLVEHERKVYRERLFNNKNVDNLAEREDCQDTTTD